MDVEAVMQIDTRNVLWSDYNVSKVVDCFQNEVRRLRDEIQDYRDACSQKQEIINAHDAVRNAMREVYEGQRCKRTAEFKQALKVYGHHAPICDKPYRNTCTCGLDALLARLDQQEPQE